MLNGANERGVQAFLDGEISYFGFYDALRLAVDSFNDIGEVNLDNLRKANLFGVNFVENYLLNHV